MANIILFLLFLSSLVVLSMSRSWLTEPQSTAPRACSVGGLLDSGNNGSIRTCGGPCDAGFGAFLQSSSPSNPAGMYRRGERVTIKYARNGVGPGGFIRLTLVPLDHMMDKAAHAANAFHYSCFGANPTAATRRDIRTDQFGFNIAGEDGTFHNGPVMIYETHTTIPTVLPDGDYVLGWAWYGGIGGTLEENQPENPARSGFFGDYWSCSFVRIRGGPLRSRYNPLFINDMKDVWPNGCYAASNRLGDCAIEPCRNVNGRFLRPSEFVMGRPRPLRRTQFEPPNCRGGRVGGFCNEVPTPRLLNDVLEEALIDRYNCIYPNMKRQPFMFS